MYVVYLRLRNDVNVTLEAELLGVRTASILPDINEKWMPNLTLGTTSVLNCREEIDKFWSENFP